MTVRMSSSAFTASVFTPLLRPVDGFLAATMTSSPAPKSTSEEYIYRVNRPLSPDDSASFIGAATGWRVTRDLQKHIHGQQGFHMISIYDSKTDALVATACAIPSGAPFAGTISPSSNTKAFFAFDVIVSPEHRRKGLGTGAMTRLLKHLEAQEK